jgi:hypothetical protein
LFVNFDFCFPVFGAALPVGAEDCWYRFSDSPRIICVILLLGAAIISPQDAAGFFLSFSSRVAAFHQMPTNASIPGKIVLLCYIKLISILSAAWFRFSFAKSPPHRPQPQIRTRPSTASSATVTLLLSMPNQPVCSPFLFYCRGASLSRFHVVRQCVFSFLSLLCVIYDMIVKRICFLFRFALNY